MSPFLTTLMDQELALPPGWWVQSHADDLWVIVDSRGRVHQAKFDVNFTKEAHLKDYFWQWQREGC